MLENRLRTSEKHETTLELDISILKKELLIISNKFDRVGARLKIAANNPIFKRQKSVETKIAKRALEKVTEDL